MAESSRSLDFSNLPVTYWTPSEYDLKIANVNSSNNFCKVCNVELNSREQYTDHLKGQKHFSKSQKVSFGNSSLGSNSTSMMSLPNLNNNNDNNLRRGASLISLDNLSDGRGSFNDDSVSFGDDKHCNLCDIYFTSPAHRNDHYRGKKHNIAISRSKMKDIPLNCDVCGVPFSSEISAKAHFDSLKHKKKDLYGSNSSLPIIGDSLPIIGTDNTRWVRCDVCKVELNSMQQLAIHKDSPRHKKRELQSSASNRRSSLMIPFSVRGESPLLNGRETSRDHSNPTPTRFEHIPNGLLSTPFLKTAKESIATRLFPDTSTETPTQKSNDYDSKKTLNNLENSCDTKPVPVPDSSLRSNNNELQPDDTFTKSPQLDSDSVAMKKVNNSIQSNNNPSDITAKSLNNSLTMTNNLSLPQETIQNKNDTTDTDSVTPDISTESIANIIDGIKNLTMVAERSATKKSTDSVSNEETNNITNEKILKSSSATGQGNQSSSATGHGSQRPKSSRSSSVPKNVEDDLPYLLKMWIEKIEKNGKFICYFCNLCESQMNPGAVENHIQGVSHRQKMMTRRVPERDLPPVEQHCEDATEEAFDQTEFCPRGYQVELFEKCHSTDSIIFLPTGTGKTLIASMLISYMLKKNPKRSVLFLVDKVLLVFQQKKFIEEQLKKKILRFDLENTDELVERELNIACVCGGTVGIQDRPLWMHDIIISTAAFCSNMMDQSVLRWSDFSFVVVDEAHHCVKSHPFRRIFKKQHSTLEKSQRPKILGLTASPAGQESLGGTIGLLASLMIDMGDAKIRIVEDTVDELNKYKSNARLEIELLPPSNEEMSFNHHLQEYLMTCLLYLKQKSNICDLVDFLKSGEKIVLTAEKLDDLQTAYNLLSIDKDKAAGTSLLWHVQKITSALAVSLEMGIPLALEELKSLSDESNNVDSFSKALELGLPCSQIKEMCEKYSKVMLDDTLWEQDEIMTTVYFLIHKITNFRGKKENKNAIILVLVKQRATAMRLSAIMQKSNAIQKCNLSCVSLVGHGAGTGYGMNVKDQKKTLEEIKDNQHQVIVATSVAEEGIDLPECSLVITLKPPTSITTLVQMRGRARKKNSLFLTICGNEDQKEKLEKLLNQEKTMEMATRKLVEFYKNK